MTLEHELTVHRRHQRTEVRWVNDPDIHSWHCTCGVQGYSTATLADHVCELVTCGETAIVTPTTPTREAA